MWIANDWKEYEVIDTSCGEKLERWGKYTLVRPDPQVIWDTPKISRGWKNMNAHYHRSKKGGGEWEFFDLPQQWDLHYKDLTFHLKPFSFKHTGLFPEQAVNWDWFGDKIRKAGRPIKVLNLFAYTGGATLAAAAAGAQVTHVDASKGMVTWAKENAAASGLSEAPIRWLVDDCVKFVEREIRRGNHYDAIIMDPPSYGRGPKGEIWKIEEAIHPLIKLCVKLLSPNPLTCRFPGNRTPGNFQWAGTSMRCFRPLGSEIKYSNSSENLIIFIIIFLNLLKYSDIISVSEMYQ